jgi:hypothetical protein
MRRPLTGEERADPQLAFKMPTISPRAVMQPQEHVCVQLLAHKVALRERPLRILSFTLSSRKWGRFMGFHRQELRGSLSHHPIRARDGKIANCLPIIRAGTTRFASIVRAKKP